MVRRYSILWSKLKGIPNFGNSLISLQIVLPVFWVMFLEFGTSIISALATVTMWQLLQTIPTQTSMIPSMSRYLGGSLNVALRLHKPQAKKPSSSSGLSQQWWGFRVLRVPFSKSPVPDSDRSSSHQSLCGMVFFRKSEVGEVCTSCKPLAP